MTKMIAVGIGITDKCNYSCQHCYSRDRNVHSLTYDDVKTVVDSLPVSCVNFGTGESILHPDFLRIANFLLQRKIPTSLTTNGYSISKMTDDQLKWFHDLDVSIDFPTEIENDIFRNEGSTREALKILERLASLGIETSIVSCMTNHNFAALPDMVTLARNFQVNLRVNVYKPVRTDKFVLSYEQFWEGIRGLLSSGNLVSCSEPMVRTALGINAAAGGCSCGKTSLRITPKGKVIPCVYWGESDISISDIAKRGLKALETSRAFQESRLIPEECLECIHVDSCQGGCAGQRFWSGIDKGDPYCYILNKREKPEIDWSPAETKDLIHSQYLCTIIVS